MILDGDEVWTKRELKRMVETIALDKDRLDCVGAIPIRAWEIFFMIITKISCEI